MKQKTTANNSRKKKRTIFRLRYLIAFILLILFLSIESKDAKPNDNTFSKKIENVYNFKQETKDINKKEFLCLAENIFWEVRGKSKKEAIMVANVTMNRVESERYSDSVCGVVYEPYQFSWTHQGKTRSLLRRLIDKNNLEYLAWQEAKKIAKLALTEELPDYTNGAEFYHTNKVKPKWNFAKLEKTKKGEYHTFYAMR